VTRGALRSVLTAALIWSAATPLHAAPLEAEIRVRIELTTGRQPGTYELEGFLVMPSSVGRAPLALIAHGSPRDPGGRARMKAVNFAGVAREFAGMGWASAVVLRRGYGSSDGSFAEGITSCEQPGYAEAGQETARELAAIATALSKRPEFEPRTIIVGLSVAGFGALAVPRDAAPGLTGIINFSGGHGSLAPFRVCVEEELVGAIGRFGAKNRTPTLWLYAEDDSYFGPQLVARMHAAYRRAGGLAELVMFSGVGRDGHDALVFGRPDLWRGRVSRYLQALPPR
jgi:pimeloyl-ACP methyl ester carboxylesterase